jgi:thioredoxin 1
VESIYCIRQQEVLAIILWNVIFLLINITRLKYSLIQLLKKMTQLTAQEVKEKIENKESFVLDLFATWCGPCKVLMGNLNALEKNNNDLSMPIYSLDIDTDRDFVMELGIRSVPTLKMYKGGEEVFSNVGVLSQSQLLEVMGRY